MGRVCDELDLQIDLVRGNSREVGKVQSPFDV
jgi:hypothetical protein